MGDNNSSPLQLSGAKLGGSAWVRRFEDIDAVENNCCDRHFGDRYCDAIDVLDTERVLVWSRARNAYPLLLLDQLPQTENYVFDHNLT